jgi:AraC-like DNA-binding protein
MGLSLTVQEIDAIALEAEQDCPPVVSADGLETLCRMPPQIGHGYRREIELCPGLELGIFHETHNDLTVRVAENQHLVQFMVHLSGVVDCGDFLYQDSDHSYIGGSGIQKSVQSFHPACQTGVGVDIHLNPHLFHQLFAEPNGELPGELQCLVQDHDWQRVFSPRTTRTMRSVVQQIIDCPLTGFAKRMYLQGKAFELMALQLGGAFEKPATDPLASLKPDTIARIYHAAEILRSHLEDSPQQPTLAQQVGVSDRTLQRGFKIVFGVTPFAYLTQQRMKCAKELLQESHQTIADIATQVGYASPSQFAAAFRRQFGISPSECLGGKGLG